MRLFLLCFYHLLLCKFEFPVATDGLNPARSADPTCATLRNNKLYSERCVRHPISHVDYGRCSRITDNLTAYICSKLPVAALWPGAWIRPCSSETIVIGASLSESAGNR